MTKTLKHTLQMFGLIIAMLVSLSCERRPLYDGYGGNVYLEIEVETEVEKKLARGPVPVGMSVNFYNLKSHSIFMNTIVGPTGGYMSVNPGTYDLMVYNYDTEYTRVRNENNSINAEAFTNEAPGQVRRSYENLMRALAAVRGESTRDYAGEPLVNQPDHLYVGKIDKVFVPMTEQEDQIVTIHVVASTLVDTYKLIVRTVTGMEYISEADAIVTGQASSKLLYNRTVSGGPASLHVPLAADGQTEFSSMFTTFGKYDNDNGKVWVVLRVIDLSGKVYTWEFDVTDQVDSGSHVIVVDADIHVEPTGGSGGLAPDIDEWGEINTNINM